LELLEPYILKDMLGGLAAEVGVFVIGSQIFVSVAVSPLQIVVFLCGMQFYPNLFQHRIHLYPLSSCRLVRKVLNVFYSLNVSGYASAR
jgi:hypothetical protein